MKTGELRKGKYHQYSITELIGLVLVANNGLPMSAREVWTDLAKLYHITTISEQHVRALLSKLLRDQRILRTSRGCYRCTQQDLEIHAETRPRGKATQLQQNNTTAK